MMTPLRTPRPIGPNIAIIAKTNSIRLMRQICLMAAISIRPRAVAIRIAPSTGMGMTLRAGARKTRVATRVAAATMLVTCERPPTFKLTAVRESGGTNRNGADQAGRNVRGTESDQLAVRIDLISADRPETAGGDDARSEADQKDRGRAERQCFQGKAGKPWQVQRGQIRRDIADHGDAASFKVEDRRKHHREHQDQTGPGTGKRTIRTTCNKPNMPRASTRDGQWIDPAFCRSSTIGLSKPSDSMSTPVTRSICPIRIESEMPVKNPVRIGRDRKFARTPSRSTHAAR